MTAVKISDTNPIHYQDATTLAALIRTKQLSSREVVQAHLDRISAVNPQINAVVTLMADDALRSADAADKVVADGAALGPLHGVPFSIKDALDTAGVLTQRGSRLFAGNIPEKDACPYRELYPVVMVMQSAEDRPRGELTELLDRPMGWRILAQGQMRSERVVIARVGGKDPAQVGFAEDDRVIKAFPADRADQSLRVPVLPR